MPIHYSPDPDKAGAAPTLMTVALCVIAVCATILIATSLICRAIGEKHQSVVKIELSRPVMEVK